MEVRGARCMQFLQYNIKTNAHICQKTASFFLSVMYTMQWCNKKLAALAQCHKFSIPPYSFQFSLTIQHQRTKAWGQNRNGLENHNSTEHYSDHTTESAQHSHQGGGSISSCLQQWYWSIILQFNMCASKWSVKHTKCLNNVIGRNTTKWD